ncbi:hypothetical protein [Candidatus Nitrospira nitrosa]|uniref:hypothetical protein n=1 Tax=Candidatus Nitrospira nitrosa TaxID=1742972 RepID=UPI0011476075|nr:hypothetical protein [Candidatus Nitrospira nitrosa]
MLIVSQLFAMRSLYPKSFIRSIPRPEHWDRRPLPNLFHGALNQEQEIEKLERWYKELKSYQKLDLRKRLRSLTFRDFWSAYYELMASRIAKEVGSTSIQHSPLLGSRRPDFIVQFPDGNKQVWEVATAYQRIERENDDDKSHELASWLNQNFEHQWGVLVDAERFNSGGLSINGARPIVQAWLDKLDNGGPRDVAIGPPLISCHLTLTASQRHDIRRPIVEGLAGQGGNITATDQVRNTLRKKVKKYKAVQKQELPLIIFLFEGDRLHISRESLQRALWGEWQSRMNRNTGESSWVLAPGGLFMPDQQNTPQNTRLSAVVYGQRRWHNSALHAALFVYHHPMARHPLPDSYFAGLPQSYVTLSDFEFKAQWSHSPKGETNLLRLG